MNSRESFLELRQYFASLILLTVKFPVQCFVLSVRQGYLVHQRLFEWVKLFPELSHPIKHPALDILEPRLEYLKSAVLYIGLIILMMLLLLLHGYLFLDMFRKQMHLLLDTVRLHSRRRVLAQRTLYLRDHLSPQIFNQARQLIVTDVQQVLLQLRDQLD